MDNSEEFSKLFSELEELIKKRAFSFGLREIEVPFGQLLHYLGEDKKDHLVRRHYTELDRLNEIRNLVTGHPHPTLKIEPTQDCLLKLRELIDIFQKRIKAENIMTKNVFTAQLNDSISDAIKVMIEKEYSQVPLVDSMGRVIELLTEHSIVRWLKRKLEEGVIDLEKTKVSEVISPQEPGKTYLFIPRNLELEKIQDIFIENYQKQEPLFALIVTHSGNKEEKILGIVTPYDAFLKKK
jgi:predicted transcriptional regulator